MPTQEVTFLLTYLMGGPQGRAQARRIDAKVDTLAGLQGLHLVERALDARGIRA